jgi:hypothetical protein
MMLRRDITSPLSADGGAYITFCDASYQELAGSHGSGMPVIMTATGYRRRGGDDLKNKGETFHENA